MSIFCKCKLESNRKENAHSIAIKQQEWTPSVSEAVIIGLTCKT